MSEQMGAGLVLKLMTHHGLSIFAPTNSGGVPAGARWCARDNRATMLGFGATPAEAVEDALKPDTRVPISYEEEEDFLR